MVMLPMARRNSLTASRVVTADAAIESLDDYVAAGGGEAMEIAARLGPGKVIDEIERAGLRGRGGAGFPTGRKWRTIRTEGAGTRFAVCNAAEGEPGTYKDRWLLSQNPYQVLEGLAIAAWAVGARRSYLAIKRAFTPQIERVRAAVEEMRAANLLGPAPLEIVEGPDEYLFGEESGLLEVIEGNDPLPRILPPFQDGLFAGSEAGGGTGLANPTLMNNVETLANVPHILRNGAGWFRSLGSESSPGTMVFTLSGDVVAPGMYELPLGVPLRTLVEEVGGGAGPGRSIKAVFPGASAGVLTERHLDVPLDFDAMRAAGSGLGSAGFVAYDDSACIVAAALVYARFLYVESCAQCPPCKAGSGAITDALERIERGEGTDLDVAGIEARSLNVTDARRCALPVGMAEIAQSVLRSFAEEIRAHLGSACPLPRDLPVPKVVDFDPQMHRFAFDERYALKRPDWTYAPR